MFERRRRRRASSYPFTAEAVQCQIAMLRAALVSGFSRRGFIAGAAGTAVAGQARADSAQTISQVSHDASLPVDAPATFRARQPFYGTGIGRCQASRRRLKRLLCCIQAGSGMPSRCRPPASAPAQAAITPSSKLAAIENARMIVLARARVIARFESAMTVSTRRSASGPVRPVTVLTV